MPRHPSTSFRLDPAILKRAYEYAERLQRETGLPVTRQAAIEKLLRDALDAAERERGKRKR